MNYEPNEKWRPELLAGYVDGELGHHDRREVDKFLAARPQEKENFEAQKSLARKGSIWQKTEVPMPSDATWQQLNQRIHAALQPKTTPAPNYSINEDGPRVPSWRRPAAAVAVIAASLVLAVGFNNRGSDEPTKVTPAGEVFAVANHDDVEIISVEGDGSTLLVGRPPLDGPLDIVTTGDIVALSVDSSVDLRIDPKSADMKDPRKPILIPAHDKTQPVP